MVKSLSYWNRTASLLAVAVSAAILSAFPGSASAQDDDLSARCRAGISGPAAECFLAASAVRLIHPRVGTALWGGSPVPGSASTLGMRLGSVPRFTVAGRLVVLPIELPPLTDRGERSSRALAAGLSGQTTVGILPGWSPLPTVGGFMSLDATVRGSLLRLPDNQGFEDSYVLGGSVGLRLGLLRESFTLPGISVTGAYGRSTDLAFGDPTTDDGHIDGAIAGWNLTGAITKRTGPVGVTAGVALDRYSGEVDFSHRGFTPGGMVTGTADAVTDRWSAFGNLSWTFLVFHASLEAGWQESPMPEGLPASISVDPTGWWAGAAFRLSI